MFPSVASSDEMMSRMTRRTLFGLLSTALIVAATGANSTVQWRIVEMKSQHYVMAEDVKRYYRFSSVERQGRHVHFRSKHLYMKWGIGTDALFINNVKFCLCFPIEEKDGQALISRMDLTKLVDPIINPGDMKDAKAFNTVVIDAGHGGHDPGTAGLYGRHEKEYTLDTAFRVKKALEKYGFKTVMTRSSDVWLDRPERVRIANATPHSVFVSLHYNSFRRSAMGFETFALAPQGTAITDKPLKQSDLFGRMGNQRDAENIALATAVHANCLFHLRSIDRGVKRHRFDVLAGIERPAILVEGGFIDNVVEGARVHRDNFRQLLAESVATGIRNFYLAIKKPAPPAGPSRVPIRSSISRKLPAPPDIAPKAGKMAK